MFGRTRSAPAPVSLSQAVRDVAENPGPEHQWTLVGALAKADALILMKVPADAPDSGDGTTGADNTDVATAVAPDGRSFLQAFTDVATAQAKFPTATFLSVAPEVAFRMSIANGNQGLLITGPGGDDCWAAVTAEGIAGLLNFEPEAPIGVMGMLRRGRARKASRL